MNRDRFTSAHPLAAVLLALLVGAAGPARGTDAAASAPRDERARIASERAEVEARFSERERECRTRFIVTSCVDDAKAERRQALDKLRVRQLAVDEERRRERTAQRQAELAEKAAEDARRDRERAAHMAARAASDPASQGAGGNPFEFRTVTRGAAASSSASGAAAHPFDAGLGVMPHVSESAAVRQEREASSRAAFEARQREAAEHREAALQRAARRTAAKPPAAPLPVPAAASAALRR